MWKAYGLFFLGLAFIAVCTSLFELAAKLICAVFKKKTTPQKQPGDKQKDWLN